MKKIFYIFCFLWVAFALFLALGSQISSIGRLFIAKNGIGSHTFGDLYEMTLVDLFKGWISYKNSQEIDTIYNSDIITMGDSFFQTQYDSEFFGNELEKRLNKKVFAVKETIDNPLEYLQRTDYQKGKKRTLILGTIERFSLTRSLMYGNTASRQALQKTPDNKNMEYFFRNNIIVKSLERLFKIIEFNIFGIIDSRTPLYSLNPPMLFFSEDMDFAKSKKPDYLIRNMADNIKNLDQQLKGKYNLDLVYVVIPNKYTIYNDFVKNGFVYDDFIPRLNKELKKDGVAFIDLYKKYKEYRAKDDRELLYYPSDTHYTALGKSILVDEAAKEIVHNPNGQKMTNI